MDEVRSAQSTAVAALILRFQATYDCPDLTDAIEERASKQAEERASHADCEKMFYSYFIFEFDAPA